MNMAKLLDMTVGVLSVQSKGARATHSRPHVRPVLRVSNFSECMSHFVHVEKRLLYCTDAASVNHLTRASIRVAPRTSAPGG